MKKSNRLHFILCTELTLWHCPLLHLNATNVPAAEEHLKELKTAREEALAAHELAYLKMTQRMMR